MTKLGLILGLTSSLLCTVGCDTGNSSVDHAIGKSEVITGRTAQGVGEAVVAAPDRRAKVVGTGLIAGGVVGGIVVNEATKNRQHRRVY